MIALLVGWFVCVCLLVCLCVCLLVGVCVCVVKVCSCALVWFAFYCGAVVVKRGVCVLCVLGLHSPPHIDCDAGVLHAVVHAYQLVARPNGPTVAARIPTH